MAIVGLQLIIDSEGNVTGIERVEEGLDRLQSNAQKAERELARVGMAADRLANSAIVMGGAGMMAAYGMAQAASNLGEAQNKVNVVFGESAESVQAWSEGSARAMGLSQRAALQAAGSFGILFQSMEPDKAAEMSQEMVQLAADLASINDINPEEALEKLRAGLRGEVEPLSSLGVLMNAASVEAKALEMGLGGTGGAAADAARQLTRAAQDQGAALKRQADEQARAIIAAAKGQSAGVQAAAAAQARGVKEAAAEQAKQLTRSAQDQARAMRESAGGLSEAAKVQARYAIILEQSSKQQGDFARTSGELANAQRIQKAALEDAAAAAGGALTEGYQAALAASLPLIEATTEFVQSDAGQAAVQFAAGFSAVALAAGGAYKGFVALQSVWTAGKVVAKFLGGQIGANTVALNAETAALGTNTAAQNANAAAAGRAGAARGAGGAGAAGAGAPKPASSAGTKLLGAGAIVAGVAYAGHLQKQQYGEWQQGYEEAGGGLGGVAGAWKRGMGWTYDKATDLLAPEMGGYNPARMVHDRYIRPRVEAWSGYSGDEEVVPAERAPVQAQPVQIPRSTIGGLPGPTQIPTRATSGGEGRLTVRHEHHAGDALAAQLARSPEVQSMAERVVERRMRQ